MGRVHWLLAVVVLGACGRISFDSVERDAATGVADAVVDATVDAAPDAAPLACSLANFVCPGGSVRTCGNTCFATCVTAMAWTEAQDLCVAWGGNLARTDLPSEITCLAGEINDAWIALVQDASTTPGGGWRWSHGGPMGFTAWLAGEPDDFDSIEDGAEQCGLFSSSGWIDDGCTSMKNVACSRPAP
jgi:hypothetical protein